MSKINQIFNKNRTCQLWQKCSRTSKITIVFGLVIGLLISSSYGLAYWYQQKHKNEPLVLGATFTANYARYFDLEPKEVLSAMINDLGIRRFRLVSYWDIHEPEENKYDFSELDWQFDMIEQAGGEVALSLGLRQPRWPECHAPKWAMQKPISEWSEDLLEYTAKTVNRYKNRPSLAEYQLENEYFLKVFGDCPDHSRERLVKEFNFIKQLDPNTPLIVNRSNNAIPSWPVGQPRADKVGATIYKRVWDKTITKRNFEYPLPPWFYSFLAAGTELTTGRDSIIHELQMESWLPENKPYDMRDAPLSELYKTFSPEMVEGRIKYAVDSGIRTIDLWGVEWWCQLKTKRNAPEMWSNTKKAIQKYQNVSD